MTKNNLLSRIKGGELPSISYMLKRINSIASIYAQQNNIKKVFVVIDYWFNALIYGCNGLDYFLYDYFYLNRQAKKRLVTDQYKYKFEHDHSNINQHNILENKEQLLNLFQTYIKREWCGITKRSTEEDYKNFYESNENAIIKPKYGFGGIGIEFVNLAQQFDTFLELRKYCTENNVIVEEIIKQNNDLNKLNPNSINDVRIVTLKGETIGAALRIGTGNAKVDNAHSGGIFAEVDIDTGIIIGKAMDYQRNKYITHPNTKTIIPGFQIPFWDDCIKMVEDASKMVSAVWLVGWDVGITPTGPVIIEANTNPGLELIQAPNGHGLKEKFEEYK